MKKFLLLSLLALFSAASARAAGKSPREEYVTHVETCEAVLQEIMADPATAIPAAVLQRAKALIILNQFKAGFYLGFKGGYGVILAKKTDGRWSLPVLIRAGEASIGFQVGAQTVETAMVITDDKVARLLYTQRFNIGADAEAVAGPHVAEVEQINQHLLEVPVLVYTKARGLFAGATIRGGWLQRNDKANFILYNTIYTMPELLYSDWVQPVVEVQPLMNYVQRIAP